jgi:NADH:ubiquinone reductase (H+-translocating)
MADDTSTPALSLVANGRPDGRHRVVIIGAGFGGLFAARALKHAAVDVTVLDRTNHHLFQPLLYQVATGVLSEGDIAPPTRDVLRKFKNTRVLLGNVVHIDVDSREVVLDSVERRSKIPYDSLIVAAGASQSYFGHEEFAPFAPGMKTIDDALGLRGRIFGAFELAELEADAERRASWLKFAVIGAGPTGVELAGQIAELSRRALKLNYREFNPATSRVILVEGGDRVLASFPESLQHRARRDLERLGVELRLQTTVTDVDVAGLDAIGPDGVKGRIEAHTKIWAAGVEASPLGAILAEQTGADIDRAGRVLVLPDCTLPGYPEIFVVGDMMSLDRLAGVAEVAMQTGRHAARTITRRLKGNSDTRPFRYLDLGTMATIARFRAVVSVGRLRVAGFLGWLMWLVVHLTFMTGFKNRWAAIVNWAAAFLGRGRRQRVITEHSVREAITALAEKPVSHQQSQKGARMPPPATGKLGDGRATPLELAAVRFHGQATAASRYGTAVARVGDAPWTRQVGFVERHRNGHLLIHGTFAGHYVYFDESDHVSQPRVAEGSLAGGLIGVLLGPPGLAVGLTIGAFIGSQSGSPSDVETEPEPLLAQLREAVEAPSSAIVAIARATDIDDMVAAVATDAASLVRRALTDQEESTLVASLASAPAVADRSR